MVLLAMFAAVTVPDASWVPVMVPAIINPPSIGPVTVLPGDVVLARREGVIIIPPHLAEEVVVTAEIIALKDEFGNVRLREGGDSGKPLVITDPDAPAAATLRQIAERLGRKERGLLGASLSLTPTR